MPTIKKTYLFYDIETTGLNKVFDQIIQFAAIRTDLDFNEIERYEYVVRLNCDVVPSPKAFITHRFSLSKLEQGLNEIDAILKIHALFNTPGTITIGYNSLAFDDEFLRFSFYRNLLPAYTHQYANNCSRMDLYPITVMYFLYKNALLKWPKDNLKLENISKLNNLQSGMAHNAMVDVSATLNLAKCFREELTTWNYLIGFFNKQIDFERCQGIYQRNSHDFGIMIDGKFGALQHYQAAVLPLGVHHYYKNQSVWLRLDSDNLFHTNEENFLDYTWVINKKMGEPAWILPKKERFFRPYIQERKEKILEALCRFQNNHSILKKISDYYLTFTYPKVAELDAGAALYDRGFVSRNDQDVCKKIHASAHKDKLNFLNALSQEHLQELLIRIGGRYFPEALKGVEKEKFTRYMEHICSSSKADIFLDYRGKKRLTPNNALLEIEEVSKLSLDEEQKKILIELEAYITKKFVLQHNCKSG